MLRAEPSSLPRETSSSTGLHSRLQFRGQNEAAGFLWEAQQATDVRFFIHSQSGRIDPKTVGYTHPGTEPGRRQGFRAAARALLCSSAH